MQVIGWESERVGGQEGEQVGRQLNGCIAISWSPTAQLKLRWGQLSWSVGAECGDKVIYILNMALYHKTDEYLCNIKHLIQSWVSLTADEWQITNMFMSLIFITAMQIQWYQVQSVNTLGGTLTTLTSFWLLIL